MKEENSRNKQIGALAIAVIMLLAVFAPVSQVSAETGETNGSQINETGKMAGSDTQVSEISLNYKKVSLHAGKTVALKAAVTPGNVEAKTINWKSSNTAVATVSASGVVAVKGAGTATVTAAAHGKTAVCSINGTLAAPTRVKAKSLNTQTIRVTWKKTAGAAGYKVYRATKKNGKYKRIATIKSGKTTSYKNKKRATGKVYYYKVIAYSGRKTSALSKKTAARAKPAQTKVKAKAGEELIKVSWNKVGGAHGYHVYKANSKKGKYKRVKIVKKAKTTSFTNTSLKAGKAYYYKVRAYRVVKGKKVFASHSDLVSAKAKKVKLKKSKQGFEYKKKFTVKAYAYTGGGRTAMGTRARVGAIAVDPDVIPLGTKVYVEGYGYARAEDTGGNINGRTIDVYKNSIGACNNWGVRYQTIYVNVRK